MQLSELFLSAFDISQDSKNKFMELIVSIKDIMITSHVKPQNNNNFNFFVNMNYLEDMDVGPHKIYIGKINSYYLSISPESWKYIIDTTRDKIPTFSMQVTRFTFTVDSQAIGKDKVAIGNLIEKWAGDSFANIKKMLSPCCAQISVRGCFMGELIESCSNTHAAVF